MKKKMILICAVVVVAVLAFAACSTPEPAPSPAVSEPAVTSEIAEAVPSATVEESTPEAVTMNGSWTNPLNGDVLTVNADGTWTIADETGAEKTTGTYKAVEGTTEFDATFADGTTGSLVLKDTVVEFINGETGEVTLYESVQAE